MEESKQTAAQQQDATPAEKGEEQRGRTFTQDEVNQIVSNRLAQERAKAEPSEQDKREQEFAARESRLSCREYITEKNYPDVLLYIFPTSDKEAFQASVEKLKEAFPHIFNSGNTGMMTASTGVPRDPAGFSIDDLIASAFKRKG